MIFRRLTPLELVFGVRDVESDPYGTVLSTIRSILLRNFNCRLDSIV